MSTLFTCALARQKINHQTDGEYYAVLTFNPPAMTGAERAPIDVTVAMDVSGSMGGGKLDSAKKSLLKLVEHLTDKDRLGVVAFESSVEVVFNPLSMTAANKKEASQKIKGMRTLGGTNLSGGVLQALSLLKDNPSGKETVRRALAFTDGQANEGVSNADALCALVSEHRARIPVSTFGYGNDHDPVLLGKLAQDGSFYFIDTPDKILTAFGQELGGLISTYAQNVEVRLEPAEGVEILEVLNDLTVTKDGDAAVIRCDDLLAEQPYNVVVKLKVGKRDNAFPRDTTLVRAKAKFFDLVAKKQVEEPGTIKVRFVKPGEEDTKDNESLSEHIALQLLGQSAREAEKKAQAGDFMGARAVLMLVREYSCTSGVNIAADILNMADGLANEAYGSQALYANGGSHTSNAVSKGISRQRAAMAGGKVGGVDFDAKYGTKAQANVAKDFEAAPKVVTDVPVKPTTSGSFEKRRSSHS